MRKYQAGNNPKNQFSREYGKHAMFAPKVVSDIRKKYGITKWQLNALIISAEWQKQIGWVSPKLIRRTIWCPRHFHLTQLKELVDMGFLEVYRYWVSPGRNTGVRSVTDTLYQITNKTSGLFRSYTRRLNNLEKEIQENMANYRMGVGQERGYFDELGNP